MARSGIPGLDEALAQESRERNLAYLSEGFSICGVSVPQITPITLCKLIESRSPFIYGTEPTREHCGQFVYLVRNLAPQSDFEKKQAIAKIHADFGKHSLAEIVTEIFEFVDITLRDQGGSSKGSTPIASNLAWWEYRFSGKPWQWKRNETLNTPLRILFQQLRCQEKEHGEAVVNNLSHKVKGDFLKEMQRHIDEGGITHEQIADLQNLKFPKKDA